MIADGQPLTPESTERAMSRPRSGPPTWRPCACSPATRTCTTPGWPAGSAGWRSRVLVLWGDSDRIVTPGYGQALAAAFPQAQFTVISQAGHLPQLEQPDATFGALDAFIRKDPGRPAA